MVSEVSQESDHRRNRADNILRLYLQDKKLPYPEANGLNHPVKVSV